jgi:outer membrane murein-binding lipoprotein Lpp
MRPIALAAALASTALLAGCGDDISESRQVIQAVSGAVLSVGRDTAPVQRPQFSRAAIEETGQEFVLASVPQRGVAALLQRAGENGPEVTWLTEDGVSVTYENGFLVATRGLGPDLMAADVSGVAAAVAAGGGAATRIHEYLDGNDQMVRHEYACRVERTGAERITIYERSHSTEKYEETCRRGGQTFANTYWVDARGVVWKSRQLISPPVGYLDSERL